ncbi:MAG: flagellar hook-associated protein FlgK [Rhodobacter sp.]|nr:flagellar hook-associated protein FlgK [Paracoccaceae bacterium]MCC0077723.1 flagellar hook-associated protein FlgK [Rhodobacter sp.]
MSISSALQNATSGLFASARAVQVASANVANAMTAGYAPRRIELTSATLGGTGAGVRITGITREVDPVLVGMLRDADATSQAGTRNTAFWTRIEGAVGLPGAGIQAALSNFETALISASDRPDLDSRLAKVASAAVTLADTIGAAGDTVQILRAEADAAIARDVEALNTGLGRVDALNAEITRLRAAGQETLGLEDQRQALISDLAAIVPMREYARADGRITLFSAGGQLLLDLDPQEIGFTPAPAMDASMTPGAGLSGLTVGGLAVTADASGPLAGGTLAASVTLRDTIAPGIQAELDTLAADLIARFQDPQADATLGPGVAGLFTDAGAALSGSPAAGLTARLGVNPAVLPDQGGALWRLRDGLGAASPGAVGNASGLAALLGALDRTVSPGPGMPAQSLSASLGDLSARLSTHAQAAQDSALTESARYAELNDQMLAQGVDTDAEMQRLLTIEQSYAANARVIQTADAMLQRLLEI